MSKSFLLLLLARNECWEKYKKTSIYIISKKFYCPLIFENMCFFHLHFQCVHVIVDFHVCFDLLVFFGLRYLVAKWVINCISNCATEHGLYYFLHNCSYSVSLAIEYFKLDSQPRKLRLCEEHHITI